MSACDRRAGRGQNAPCHGRQVVFWCTEMNHWRAAAVIAALVALALGPTNAVAEPTASFTFTPAIPLAGDTVSLDGSQAADPTHDNYFYAWDFDDGTGDEGAQ